MAVKPAFHRIFAFNFHTFLNYLDLFIFNFLSSNGNFLFDKDTVFVMIWKRDRDRRVHKRPHQNVQG